MDEQIKNAVLAEATKNKEGKLCLTCAKTFALAEMFTIPARHIGDICEENDIKIVTCQLGCFK